MKKNSKKKEAKHRSTELDKNFIELKEKTDEQKLHMTSEDFKKFKPREIILFDYILKNNTLINKYSWDKDGVKVICYSLIAISV